MDLPADRTSVADRVLVLRTDRRVAEGRGRTDHGRRIVFDRLHDSSDIVLIDLADR